MYNIIRKYKNIDIQLQSSRKQIKRELVMHFITVMLFVATFFITGKAKLDKIILLIIVVIVGGILYECLLLFRIDWSLRTSNNVLFVRKWIYNYEIHFKDLINIKCKYLCGNRHFFWNYFLEITYKKENKVKSFNLDCLWGSLFLKFEYMKESEKKEFINTFLTDEKLLENKEEANNYSKEYRYIRTEQEENEIYDLLNNRKKDEEKKIWLVLFLVVLGFILFFWYIFKIT